MIQQSVQIVGLQDLQARTAAMAKKMTPAELRRPGLNVIQSTVISNRQRLDRGVDVNGVSMHTQRAAQLGLTPLGGGSGEFGRSLHGMVEPDGPLLYSTFIGARVAYVGGTIVPKHKKFLWVPARARGGRFASPERAVDVMGNRLGDRSSSFSRKSTFVLMRQGGRLKMVVQKIGVGALRVLAFLMKKIRYPKEEWAGFSRADLDNAAKVYRESIDTMSK
jgi:hypothetical protein